jgi:hypothetical protein
MSKPDDIKNLCDHLQWEIGSFGGRRLKYTGPDGTFTGTICMNDLVKVLDTISKKDTSNLIPAKNKIDSLNADGNTLLKKASLYKRALTWIKQIGNLRYNRNNILNRISKIATPTLSALAQASSSAISFSSEPPLPSPTFSTATPKPAPVAAVTPTPTPVVAITPLTVEQIAFLDQNPYIHGTGSAALALLPRTEQKLIPVWELLKKGLAPLTGELFLGGMDRVVTDNPLRLGKIKGCSYSLSRVLGYAHGSTSENTEQALAAGFLSAYESCYLTLALTCLNRANLLGKSFIKKEAIPELQKDLNKELTNIKNIYLLIPFVAKFVSEKTRHADLSSFSQIMLDAAKGVDLARFAFADSLDIDGDPTLQKMKRKLEEENFALQNKARTPEGEQHSIDVTSWSLISVSNAERSMTSTLDNYNQVLSNLDQIKKAFGAHIDLINEHFKLICEGLNQQRDPHVQIPDSDKELVDNPFGIIFIIGADQKESMTFQRSGEFTAKNPLQIGKEIKMIAVKAENIGRMQAYLSRHGIEGVEVIATEALQRNYATGH